MQIDYKSNAQNLKRLGQSVLKFEGGIREATTHHCNKVMRCIFSSIYLAIALLYYNDAPTVRAEVF